MRCHSVGCGMMGRKQSRTQSTTQSIAADHVRDCKPEHFFRFRKNHNIERRSGTTRTYIAIICVFGFIMHSHFIFRDSVKAILVHRAHRLLSKLARILCTLKTRRVFVRLDHVASFIINADHGVTAFALSHRTGSHARHRRLNPKNANLG
jgi:hypothetical protein